mmetsp:Transcript_19123/g.16014  ORF Transcript_19123/g.16014 Transcript_19123/m.16014 type:complete len:88 (-) Transcript_19123:61-324(-)
MGLVPVVIGCGICGHFLVPVIGANIWIIIFSVIIFIMIAVPWLKDISRITGILAVICTIGSVSSWIGAAFATLPQANVTPRCVILSQ